ncbi:MAG: ATPase V [Bacteroidaceae bacterium]|nr:ATPase V [Bacteroidaceae bacterium]
MITKMKKLALLVYHKEYTAFLEKLREVGVVHIQQRESGSIENPEMEQKLAVANRYARALKRLEACMPDELKPAGNPSDAAAIVELVETLLADIEQHKTLLQVLDKDIATLEPWGNFDHFNVEKLRQAGYELKFFVTAVKSYREEWESDYNAMPVAELQSRKYFVTLTPQGTTIDIDAEVAKLPTASLASLEAEYAAVNARIQEFEKQLAQVAQDGLNTIKAAQEQQRRDIEFTKVMLGGEKVSGDKLVILEGWVPLESVEPLKAMLDDSGVFYELRAARRGDNVPVKLKNNAFTRMYEVLTKMYGMPSGTDFDPTPIVAPFFSLFFAFCMGDAGYGLLMILLGFLMKKKLSKKFSGMMNLVITLGVFTTVMGALLGTFFGMSLLGFTDIPQNIRDFIIAGDVTVMGSTYDKQMLLALGIGVLHISIAMTVKAINSTVFYGFKESLSAWGWWLVVVGSVLVGSLTFLSVIPADISKWVFIAVAGLGALGIYILNNLRRNILANIGAGLWDTYNMASGLLGDILSYIRLFALGLAGGMLGQTFNDLAMMVTEGQEGAGAVIGWIGFGLIIIVGHTLNIAMSCLSAFVHPLRLTFVEYFKNAGYDGKGEEYKPFKNEE